MAVKIRLRQQGRKNRQTFRLVVTDIRNPRDGKYLETLGSYDPHSPKNNFKLNAERLNYWLSKGAELSPSAEKLVKGVAPEVITALKTQKNAARVKQAAQRRRLKKVEKKAAPVVKKAVKKEAAPAVEAEEPKKRRTTAKKTKAKDES
ncbi:MAG TPA: 30S ribosomal protein S16 [Rhabdochlamydiaceae bacterium]|jgi:small subunit ribosomal protein S16|nr:30S ribosomal protein S16 [Rhabdochlamydiaceae bacterium]